MADGQARAIRPEELLHQANRLGGRDGTERLPIDLRRAVSSAYYALFHSIALGTAHQLLPDGAPEETHSLARMVPHGGIKFVCSHITNDNTGPAYTNIIFERVKANIDLRQAADAFETLYVQRHKADYDHLEPFTRAGVLSLVDLATKAVDDLALMRGTTDLQRFHALIALQAKQPNR